MLTAITRGVSASLATGELTFRDRVPIDVSLARRQHEEYEQALSRLGVRIDHLPAEDALPDAVFVEDAGMVLDEIAIVTVPGAASRRAETESMAHAMGRYRPVQRLSAPATLDGGDVVRVDRTLYVGLSSRTNAAGIDQLGALASPLGYTVRAVPVKGALHLKTACTYAGRGVLLANPEWAAMHAFTTSMCSPSMIPSRGVAVCWRLATHSSCRRRSRARARSSRRAASLSHQWTSPSCRRRRAADVPEHRLRRTGCLRRSTSRRS
jgi:N-Dimethylarginine dimethylaminohydrolase